MSVGVLLGIGVSVSVGAIVGWSNGVSLGIGVSVSVGMGVGVHVSLGIGVSVYVIVLVGGTLVKVGDAVGRSVGIVIGRFNSCTGRFFKFGSVIGTGGLGGAA